MKILSESRNGVITTLLLTVATVATVASVAPVPATADPLWDALTAGKVDISMRYRYEGVDDEQSPLVREAHANTLRTTIGYGTGLFYDFGVYFQLEDIRSIGDERYNNGGQNGLTTRAVVVDPQGTEIQQAALRYRGFPKTLIVGGRQEIEHRAAPLNRFVGSVPWRQNWQSYDAIRMINDGISGLKIDYAYVWNVNRIFGEDNPLPDRSDFDLEGHLFSSTYSGIPYSTLEAYGYLLDFDANLAGNRALSTSTFGARFQGAYDWVGYAAKLLYTAEYAHQTDYKQNPVDIAADYYLLEFGASKAFPGPVLESLSAKVSYEVLDGDGPTALGATNVSTGFQTPLGTNHAFQGWADRFLTTPADGIVDSFVTLQARVFATNLMLTWHNYASDRDSYDFGTEWNLQAVRVFADHYTVGVKFARYNADNNALNLSRNGATSAGKQAFDSDKFWVWGEVRF